MESKSVSKARVGFVQCKLSDGTVGYKSVYELKETNQPSLRDVIVKFEKDIKELSDSLVEVIEQRDLFMTKYEELKIEHDTMLNDVKDLSIFTLD